MLALLAHNPFPDKPPRFLRARLYRYHFTNFEQRKESGNWWRREFMGKYVPVLEWKH